MKMLAVENLQFSYPRIKKAFSQANILTDISFTAASGQLICVLGENGAGKTTLFACILGLLSTYTGNIFLNGINNKTLRSGDLAKKMAYIPQVHTSIFNYSVLDMVLMGTNAYLPPGTSPKRKEEDMAWKALEKMKVAHLSNRGFQQLSGGERQLVLLARALAQQAKCILMDEPTSSLDYGNQHRVFAHIKELVAEGYLILLSTHNPDHALLYADQVLVLQQGRIAAFGPPKEVLTEPVLEELYDISLQLIPILGPDKKERYIMLPRI